MINQEIKCDICGKTGFKSKAGLAGHKKIAHGADKRKTIPDEIGKRLNIIEGQIYGLAVGIDTLSKTLVKRFTGKEKEFTVFRDTIENLGSKIGKGLAQYQKEKDAE